MVTTLALLAALAGAPAPAAAPPACITMMTDKLPLNRRVSPLDSTVFTVGTAEVKVCYGRPAVRGRKIFGGEVVPFGKLWRTGANEPTMIHTTGMIMIAGVMVGPGSYSLYTVPGEKDWEVIVNRSITQWGHESQYTPEVQKQEVGRGKAKPEAAGTLVERFTIAPDDAKAAKALVLSWENTKVSIPLMAH